MRTETLAIVFTDIKGYTAATSSQTHQENAKMLKRIERLIAPVVRAYSGRVVKSIGDAYMIVFRSPTEAVRCATAVQDRLHQHNTSSASDQAIHIRIAMNLGEVRVNRGDVFGEPVNIAARIESVTPGDDIYLSQAIYLTMNRNDLPCERVGDFELKGIPEAVTLYRVKKFVHEESAEAGKVVVGLPFGGTQLSHWRKMLWVRRAYTVLWAAALVGLASATYLRYRPIEDFAAVVTRVKAAVEEEKPTQALALAGEIPETAVQERLLVRRYRRQAVAMLMTSGETVAASSELTALLNEDPRDFEALSQRAVLYGRTRADGEPHPDPKTAMESLFAAVRISPALVERPDILDLTVRGYMDASSRRIADQIVEQFAKQNAQPMLLRALVDPAFDRTAKNVIAQRLAKLGATQEVDWVALSLDDLHSTSCKTKQTAITRLANEGDERAVGPLMKLAESKSCGPTQAKKALEEILQK